MSQRNYQRSHSRSIAWGDKLWDRGSTYGMKYIGRRPNFRHLPSTKDAVFCFGKYRGKNVMETNDLNYMLWVTLRFNLQPYQRFTLEQKITLDLRKILAKLETKQTDTNQTKKQMKKLLFDTAVLDTVCTFTENQQNFSAFDVTRKMRKLVNSGDLIVLDGTPTTFQGKATTEILHNNVRSVVREIFEQNDVSDYSPVDTGAYMLYTFNGPATATPTPLPFQTPVAPTPVATVTASSTFGFDDRVKAYILKQNARGINPTLKEVQSCLRRQGNYKCEALRDVVIRLGFKVNGNTATLSKNTVGK